MRPRGLLATTGLRAESQFQAGLDDHADNAGILDCRGARKLATYTNEPAGYWIRFVCVGGFEVVFFVSPPD